MDGPSAASCSRLKVACLSAYHSLPPAGLDPAAAAVPLQVLQRGWWRRSQGQSILQHRGFVGEREGGVSRPARVWGSQSCLPPPAGAPLLALHDSGACRQIHAAQTPAGPPPPPPQPGSKFQRPAPTARAIGLAPSGRSSLSAPAPAPELPQGPRTGPRRLLEALSWPLGSNCRRRRQSGTLTATCPMAGHQTPTPPEFGLEMLAREASE